MYTYMRVTTTLRCLPTNKRPSQFPGDETKKKKTKDKRWRGNGNVGKRVK